MQTIDNENDEDYGVISATIESGIGYKVALNGHTAVIKVFDNDPPTLTINAVTASIAESEEAWFLINATSVSDSSFPVSILIDDEGKVY